jgi:hypothetical protein
VNTHGGARKGSGWKKGRPRSVGPRLSRDEVRALLRSLVPLAVTPSDYARALGTRPERIREALRDGCTERRAGEWRDRATLVPDCAGSTVLVPG